MKPRNILFLALALLAGCASHPHSNRPTVQVGADAPVITEGSLWRFKTLTRGEYHDTRQPINVFRVTAVTPRTVSTQRVLEPAPTLWLRRSQFLADFEPR